MTFKNSNYKIYCMFIIKLVENTEVEGRDPILKNQLLLPFSVSTKKQVRTRTDQQENEE